MVLTFLSKPEDGMLEKICWANAMNCFLWNVGKESVI